MDGQLTFNTAALMQNASLEGFGLAYLTEQQVQKYLDSGELVRVLGNWCPPFPGYHLYYPSRRQPSAAFSVLVNALRYRSPARRHGKPDWVPQSGREDDQACRSTAARFSFPAASCFVP